MSETDTSDLSNETPVPETRQPSKPSVAYGGGPGRMTDSTDVRIASIEAHVDHMRDDLGDMRRDLRELTKTIISAGNDVREVDDGVSSLPGRGWMFVSMFLFTAIICAVIIYLDYIREYLKVLPPTSSVP
ncbi:MAG: hypothetical protein AB7S59_18260 [Parvibaculaceae bacterium]